MERAVMAAWQLGHACSHPWDSAFLSVPVWCVDVFRAIELLSYIGRTRES